MFLKIISCLLTIVLVSMPVLADDGDAAGPQWSTDFESGAATDLHLRDDGRIGFNIPAKPGGGEYLWFHFEIIGDGISRPAFVIENAAGAHQTGGRWNITRPVFSTDGRRWVRAVGTSYTRQSGVSNLLAEKVFSFHSPVAAETLRVAYCYPYTSTDLESFLQTIEFRGVSVSILGHSVERREIYRVDIAREPISEQDKPRIWIVCREHPGETPASFVCEGMIEALLDQPCGEVLLKRFDVTVIPMLNVDGVAHGYYYHNAGGVNLARDWVAFESAEARCLAGSISTGAEQGKVCLMINLHSSNDPAKGHFFLKMPEKSLTTDDATFQQRIFQEADGSHSQVQGKSVVKLYDLPGITGNALYRKHGVYCLYFESNYNRGADGSPVTTESLRDVGRALVQTLANVLEPR